MMLSSYIEDLLCARLLRESGPTTYWPNHKKGFGGVLESLGVNAVGLNVSPCFKAQ